MADTPWPPYSEIRPTYPALAGSLCVILQARSPYTNSPSLPARYILAGEIEGLTWSFRRNGGCHSADFKARLQDVAGQPQHPWDRRIESPQEEDWNADQWHGGEMVIAYRYDAREIETPIEHKVWRGMIAGLRYTPGSREIEIEAQGLVSMLAHVHVHRAYSTMPIRDIVKSVIRDFVSKGSSSTERDHFIRWNEAKITAPTGALDRSISIEFSNETASTALTRLLRYLPEGFLYGVDQEGDFFLNWQRENYAADMGASGEATEVVSFHVDELDRYSKTLRFDEIVNEVLIAGTEDPVTKQQVMASASCAKSRRLWGRRSSIVFESSASNLGIAGAIAAIMCRRTCGPTIDATAEVTDTLQGLPSLWQTLTPQAPAMAITERFTRTPHTDILPDGSGAQTEYILRRYGDGSGYACKDRGTAGALVTLAASAREQSLQAGWLLHLALRFTTAHAGDVTNRWAFIFGRPKNAAGQLGWGSLYWDFQLGNLWWIFEKSGGGVHAFDTAIFVDPSAPGSATVHFTAWRDRNGDWKFYNATTLAAAFPGGPSTDINIGITDGWRWFQPLHTADTVDWDGEFDHFWLLDTDLPGSRGVEHQLNGGVSAFIARNSGSPLHRNEASGLLLSIPFNEGTSWAAANGHRVWREDLAAGTRTAYVNSLGDAGGVPITLGSRTGHLLGKRKKWGGPLILNIESSTYEAFPMEGRIRRRFQLGSQPAALGRTVAEIQEKIRAHEELIRKSQLLAVGI